MTLNPTATSGHPRRGNARLHDITVTNHVDDTSWTTKGRSAWTTLCKLNGFDPDDPAVNDLWSLDGFVDGDTHATIKMTRRSDGFVLTMSAFRHDLPAPVASVGFVATDGGRRRGSLNGRGDCVTRAFAIATGRDFDDVWAAAADADRDALDGSNLDTSNVNPDDGVSDAGCILLGNRLGLVAVPAARVPGVTANGTISVKVAAHHFPNAVLFTRNHLAAVKNGDLHDLWDSRRKRVTMLMVTPDDLAASDVNLDGLTMASPFFDGVVIPA